MWAAERIPSSSAASSGKRLTRAAVCALEQIDIRTRALERARRSDAQELFSRSTDRLSRQNKICESIGKSTTRPNISAFARDFGVARRTIIRDLQELIRRGELKPEVYPEWENPTEE